MISGDDFCRELIEVASVHKTFSKVLPKIRPALELMNRGATYLEPGQLPLIELIERFRVRKATKVVDKVYALLTFSSDASGAKELRPDYNISSSLFARKIVQFAFPTAAISQDPAAGNEVSFDVEGIFLGEICNGKGGQIMGRIDNQRHDSAKWWRFNIKPHSLPGAILNPWATRIFQDEWAIVFKDARKLQPESAIFVLRGASRPTALRFKDGQYIVDMLATPEPVKHDQTTGLPRGIVPRERAWAAALQYLSAETNGLMKFRLSWDPFREPYRHKIRGLGKASMNADTL